MSREILSKIQMELKAPKNQYNSFGKYHYRSCEDILTAVKPLLEKYGATLTLSDTVEYIGDRYYVLAYASLEDGDGRSVSVRAYAREPDEKKGMDSSQITGTASSYARKYALNGLFLIDDVKDADTDEYKKQTDHDTPMASEKQINYLKRMGANDPEAAAYIKARVKSWDKLTMAEASDIIGELK